MYFLLVGWVITKFSLQQLLRTFSVMENQKSIFWIAWGIQVIKLFSLHIADGKERQLKQQ